MRAFNRVTLHICCVEFVIWRLSWRLICLMCYRLTSKWISCNWFQFLCVVLPCLQEESLSNAAEMWQLACMSTNFLSRRRRRRMRCCVAECCLQNVNTNSWKLWFLINWHFMHWNRSILPKKCFWALDLNRSRWGLSIELLYISAV